MPSFDTVCEPEMVEVKNAVENAAKEILTRFDFKGSSAAVELKDKDITIFGDSDFQLDQVHDVLSNKLAKRNVDLRFLDIGDIQKLGGDKLKRVVKVKAGIESENAKKITKLLDKVGVVYESKKLYENQVGDWIKRILAGKKYTIDPKANAMLVEFLGTDLSKISNELDKLQIILPPGTVINPIHIEENIGFSKDFNVFEFRKAIGDRNQLQAYRIAEHFAQNKKEYPVVITVSMVFNFFSALLQYHGLKDKSAGNVAKVLKVNPYFLKDYDIALKNYPMKKVSSIVASLRETDLKGKGVGAYQLNESDLLKEMLVKIFI